MSKQPKVQQYNDTQSSLPTSSPSAGPVGSTFSVLNLTTSDNLSVTLWAEPLPLSPKLIWASLNCSLCLCSCTHTLFTPQVPRSPYKCKLGLTLFCFPTIPYQLCPKSSLWLISPWHEPWVCPWLHLSSLSWNSSSPTTFSLVFFKPAMLTSISESLKTQFPHL